jgi:fluoride exporter
MPAQVPDAGTRRYRYESLSQRPFVSHASATCGWSVMGFLSVLAVGIGAFAGALLRWAFGIALNPLLPALPLGTLAANLLGGFVIGAALGIFNQFQSLPPELRLFVTTGFCGGLTTFSTFSAETVTLMLRQQYGWTAAIVAAHVIGSVLMTLAGIGLMRLLLKA